MDHNGSTQNRVFTNQFDHAVFDGTFSNTRSVGCNVTQVTDVSVFVSWGTMSLAKWIEMWASRGTTVGIVTEFVDMETSFGIWGVTSDLITDGNWFVFGTLRKVDNTRDTSVTSKNSNYKTELLVTILVYASHFDSKRMIHFPAQR